LFFNPEGSHMPHYCLLLLIPDTALLFNPEAAQRTALRIAACCLLLLIPETALLFNPETVLPFTPPGPDIANSK
jgi:hypothetical protein